SRGRREVGRLGRRPQRRRCVPVRNDRRERAALRRAEASPHAGDRAGSARHLRARATPHVHAAPDPDDARSHRHLLRDAARWHWPGARRRCVRDGVCGGAVRPRHELVSRDEGHAREQLVSRARRRRRAQPSPRRLRRDRQPREGRCRVGDPEPERDAGLSRDDGSRVAAALAMSGGRGITYARGFRAGAAKAGVKHGRPERLDVALIVSERPCVAAAVFTTDQVIAAPCVVTRRHVERVTLRAIVENSGNANACTGEQGERDAIAMAEAAAAADTTFNAISVDGDTSTNDTLLMLANGASGVSPKGSDLAAFDEGIHTVCADLARMIVADGEGATKVFEVRVRGAASAADARLAARTITNSNLVRTAVHGGDPNWGRVLAAAGRSGARVDDRRASVRIGTLLVYRDG